MIILPSLLNANTYNIKEQLQILKDKEIDHLHVDVMDGQFVPSQAFGPNTVNDLKKMTDFKLDVHLMIEEPIRYIEDFVKAGADIITVHVEACKDVVATLEKIKECGVKAAITLNPPTPVSAIEPYLDKVDMVLVMSVNPGFGGQKFIPESLDKVKEIRSLLDAKGLDTDIEIDGGVNAGNLASVLEAGANVIVAGSAIFSGDVADNVKKFKEIMGAW